MIKSEKINFLAKRNAPNPWECTYWIDLTADKDGKVWKVWNGSAWVVTFTGGEGGMVDAYTKLESDSKFATKTEVQSVADDIDDKQDTLVSGTNIKTINSQSILGAGNIEIMTEGGGISDAPSDGSLYGRQDGAWAKVTVPDTSGLATKAELANKLDTATYTADKATFALKTEIPDTSDLATKTEVQAKLDTLVSGTNIKTVNGQSILGSGNLEFTTGTGGISDAPSDGKLYGRKDANWEEVVIPENNASTLDITSYVWDTDRYKTSIAYDDFVSLLRDIRNGVSILLVKPDANTYNYYVPVGIYREGDNTYIELLLDNGEGYSVLKLHALTENPVELDGSIEVSGVDFSSTYVTSSTLDNYLTKAEATNDYATKSSIADMETQTHAAATYQVKGDYVTAASVSQATSDATFNNGHNTVSSVTGIPVSKRLAIATISKNGSFTLASTPADGREIHVIVHNTSSSNIEITMPSGSNYVKMSGDTLTVAGSSYADINVISDGTNMYIRAL